MYERPAYTDICKFKEDRSTLCKFRISAHSLEIEKGRYYNIPRENRVCLSCKAGKVEDELHLFLDCPSYAHLRQDFFEKIKSILGEVNQKVFNKCQMIALLNSNSPKLLNIIVQEKFILVNVYITNKMSTFSLLYIYICTYAS
jgi:hypothetical protein